MPRTPLVLEQLTGVNRNATKVGTVRPATLFNLLNDRQGGYTPFGEKGSPALVTTVPTTVIGNDLFGVASFQSGAGPFNYHVLEGTTEHTSGDTHASVTGAAHMPNVGVYRKHDNYFILDKDNGEVEPSDWADYKTIIELEYVGGPVQVEVIPSTVLNGITVGTGVGAGGADRVVVVGNGNVVRWSDDPTNPGTWQTPATPPTGSDDLLAVDYNGTAFVAVGKEGKVWQSTDANTWAAAAGTLPGAGDTFHDIKGTANGWAAVGGDGTASFIYATDTVSGASGWVQATLTGSTPNHPELNSVDYDSSVSTWIAVSTDTPGGVGDFGNGPIAATKADTSPTGTWNEKHTPTGAFNNSFGRDLYATAVDGQGTFIAAGEPDGKGRIDMVLSNDGGITWTQLGSGKKQPAGISSGVNVRGMAYPTAAPAVDTWLMCGDQGFVARSTDGGQSWTLVDLGEDVGVSNTTIFYDVTFDSTGDAFLCTGDGVVIKLELGLDLPIGDYQFFAFTYMATKSGKFIVQVSEQTLHNQTDKGVKVKVRTFDDPDNDPGSGDETEAPPGITAANLFTDVFVKVALHTEDPNTGDIIKESLEDKTSFRWTVVKTEDWDATPKERIKEFTDDNLSETGEPLTLGAAPFLSATNGPFMTSHGSRLWFIPSQTQGDYLKVDPDKDIEPVEVATSLTIASTEQGWVNMITQNGILQLPATQSTQITGAISTPSGLLVFGDKETFLVSGDRALFNQQIELYPDVVGNDAGVIPTKLGGIPFVIWTGRVYALQGGEAVDISDPIFLPSDPFVDVVADPGERQIIARTSGGKIYRYDPNGQFWFDDTYLVDSGQTLTDILPHPSGARYLENDGDVYNLSFPTAPTLVATAHTPYIDYVDVDGGDPMRRDTWAVVAFTVNDWDFDLPEPIAKPLMYYQINDNDPPITDENPAFSVLGVQHQNEVIFRLPRGKKGRLASFRIKMFGIPYEAIINPGITFSIVEGHRGDNFVTLPV